MVPRMQPAIATIPWQKTGLLDPVQGCSSLQVVGVVQWFAVKARGLVSCLLLYDSYIGWISTETSKVATLWLEYLLSLFFFFFNRLRAQREHLLVEV